ncbi:MAG: ribosome biogenesis GTP-binding protein YihA/YsxC [Proteobacteria bacterium]|nr:ribosome biogenesis GTP-binding protein YihA/YsxC [Pseudomonadota bacterium]MBU1641307.1 ribosome biogenesis GTP-binding protein YihA/YsxC [Pseudomonadota bacterium]
MSHWSQGEISFVKGVYKTANLPDLDLPEIAFAGRSNVGKSSLINKLVNRRSLVKVSARPGKTQALNYFQAQDQLYLVDLPGYGYAKVPRKLKNDWQGLISSYLTSRVSLRCVVVIIDIRHALKDNDLELVTWLRSEGVPHLVVYTKIDKLKRGQQMSQAALLDAGLGIQPSERLLFSAKSGEGKENLISRLDQFLA